jgi:hypothetical protein
MKIITFIFNWRGQYDKTIEKVKQLREIGVEPIVINSDDEHKDDAWHNIGEDSYFTAQFMKAIELFNELKGDVLFHIQGDASYTNWKQLYADAKKYFDIYGWGIYAPNVDYTWYDSSKVDLKFDIEEPNLKIVSNPDCTCWFIHKDILKIAEEKNVDFAPYKMGWSFDIIYTAISFMNQRPVIRDYAHTIDHPKVTNYNKDQAEKEMHAFYETLSDDIKEAFAYIKQDKDQLLNYYA